MTTQQIFEKRGYIVIGWPEPLTVGELVPSSWLDHARNPIRTPTRVIASTDAADWLVQDQMLDKPSRFGPQPELIAFYRVVAE